MVSCIPSAALPRPLPPGSSHFYLLPNLCPVGVTVGLKTLWFTDSGGKETKKKSNRGTDM